MKKQFVFVSLTLVSLIGGCGVGGGSTVDAARMRDTNVPRDDASSDAASPPSDMGPAAVDAHVPTLGATWEATILASDGEMGDHFGGAVAMSADGTRALVGCYSDTTPRGAMAGSVRVLVRTDTTWTEEATLTAFDGEANDAFGDAVAISADGTWALVGVPRDDTTAATDAGSVRTFERIDTVWTEGATLLAPDGAGNDGFGNAVAISSDGTRALVGVFRDDTAGGTDAGSAHVFVRTGATWTRETTLRPIAGVANDAFGWSVALSSDGSVAVVGAENVRGPGGVVGAGAAVVFVRETAWSESATLRALDPTTGEQLGSAVALSSDGNRALVGVWHDDTSAMDSGGARTFLRTGTTWTPEATLVAGDAAVGDGLGTSVALSGDGTRALVGAPNDVTADGATGSARLFLFDGARWRETATLIAPGSMAGDAVGGSVALSGDGTRGLLGALADRTSAGPSAGSAHVFVVAP